MAIDGETQNPTDPPTDGAVSDSVDEKEQNGVAIKQQDDDGIEYATGLRLVIIMATINLSTLIGSLDLGIVATAIPAITDDFHQLNNIGWYSGACFLTVGACSAIWGKLFKYLPVQWVYITTLSIYVLGSLIAALAPNSIALIIARAIQGVGCSGTLSGSVIIIQYTAEPKKRPMLIGFWMGIFMIATIIGPLVGGAFSTDVTWRWCFWINLPIGGFAIALQVIFLRMPKHVKPEPATWKEILLHVDIPGFSLLVTSLVCLMLSLQWGGLTKLWSDGSVIATMVLFVVLTIAFWTVEWLEGGYAIMPFHILKKRLAWSGLVFAWLCNGANFQILFYLPIYFQSVRGQSAIISGVNLIPLVAFFAVGAMVSGTIVGKTRIFQPLELIGGLLAILGAGLVYGLDETSSKAWYIGAQIPFGFGVGLSNQVPLMSMQAFATPEDVAPTTGALFTAQTIGGAYFVTSAQSIFNNEILKILAKVNPNINPAHVLGTGASQLRQVFSGPELAQVLHAYLTGVKDVFIYTVAVMAFATVWTLLVPFKKIPTEEEKKAQEKVHGQRGEEVGAGKVDEEAV